MSIANQETTVVDEKRWNAWLRKGIEAERQTAKRMKIAAGVLLALAAIAAAVFVFTK